MECVVVVEAKVGCQRGQQMMLSSSKKSVRRSDIEVVLLVNKSFVID